MSKADLLRVVADAGDGEEWTLPASVDGLRPDDNVTLYFHNVTGAEIGPWCERFNARWVSTRKTDTPAGDIYLTVWQGYLCSLPITIKHFHNDPNF
jgi:hypothetical protein